MKRTNMMRWSAFLCLAFLFGLLTAQAVERVEVSGNVSASRLPDYATVVLTGDTRLTIDAAKTLTNISGDGYDLVLMGSETLTLENMNTGGAALKADNVTSYAPLHITSGPGCAIWASEDILLYNRTFAECFEELPVIYSYHGTVSSGKATLRGYIGIRAAGGVLVTDTLDIEAETTSILATDEYDDYSYFTSHGIDNYGFIDVRSTLNTLQSGGSYNLLAHKDINLHGGLGTIALKRGHNAVYSEQGDVNIEGALTIMLSPRPVTAKTGHINISYGFLLSPEGATIESTQEGGQFIYVNDDIASTWDGTTIFGHRTLPTNTVFPDGLPAPMETLTCELWEDLYGIPENLVHYQWKIGSSFSNLQNVVGGNQKTYTLSLDHLGKWVAVEIWVEGYDGTAISTTRYISKYPPLEETVEPSLSTMNNKVYVTNARTTQEYLIYDFQKPIITLSESDWANAVTPVSDGLLELGGTINATNYVYTRIKETPTFDPGEPVREFIYLGESTSIEGFHLVLENTTGEFFIRNGERNCAGGDIIKITATPEPADADDWEGIRGDHWLVNGEVVAYTGTLYSDAACNNALNRNTNYETVYLRAPSRVNDLEVRAELVTVDGTEFSQSFRINVGDNQGTIYLSSIDMENQTMPRGSRLDNIPIQFYPLSATLEWVYAYAENDPNRVAPAISFNETARSASIDATNSPAGTYHYIFYQDGQPMDGCEFTITVTQGLYPVESVALNENYLSIAPGQSATLVAYTLPNGSETATGYTWVSSDEDVATVDENGVVTVSPNADFGAQAEITVMADGYSATCTVTVYGERFGLYIAGVQVTTLNMNDILGDGLFCFDGLRTLFVRGTFQQPSNVSLIRNESVSELVISVEEDANFSQKNVSGTMVPLISLKQATSITSHGGRLSLSGINYAIALSNGAMLRVMDADLTVKTTFASAAICGSSATGYESMIVSRSNLDVTGASSERFSSISDFGGGIMLYDCHITSPVGGRISDDSTSIVQDDGTTAGHIIIKADALLGDVNEDGRVDEADVVLLAQLLADGDALANYPNADLNGDGYLTLTDLTLLVNQIRIH